MEKASAWPSWPTEGCSCASQGGRLTAAEHSDLHNFTPQLHLFLRPHLAKPQLPTAVKDFLKAVKQVSVPLLLKLIASDECQYGSNSLGKQETPASELGNDMMDVHFFA